MAICSKSGLEEKSFLHCVYDSKDYRNLELYTGLIIQIFLDSRWKCIDKNESHVTCHNPFVARIWWNWRNLNSTCISHETTLMYRLSLHAHSTKDSFHICFSKPQIGHANTRFIKWNPLNYTCTVINLDWVVMAHQLVLDLVVPFTPHLRDDNSVSLYSYRTP